MLFIANVYLTCVVFFPTLRGIHLSFRNLSGSASRIATFKKTRIVVIHILEKALKSEDTFAVTSLSGSLAAVLATRRCSWHPARRRNRAARA
ncbi:hypothetical protein WJ972_32365 [Achromobacter insuavis]